MLTTAISILIAYLAGSLSSAIIVCKILQLPDPRTQCSMNPGTTNVLRIGGKIPALITLTGDMLKGFLPVILAHLLGVSGIFIGLVAIAALIGHIFPVFFKFQGGKGVATALGTLFALSPIAGLAIVFTWITVAAIFRYSSLAAIVATAMTPIFILLFTNHGYLLPTIIMAAIILWGHRENIQRLLNGTESKIKF